MPVREVEINIESIRKMEQLFKSSESYKAGKEQLQTKIMNNDHASVINLIITIVHILRDDQANPFSKLLVMRFIKQNLYKANYSFITLVNAVVCRLLIDFAMFKKNQASDDRGQDMFLALTGYDQLYLRRVGLSFHKIILQMYKQLSSIIPTCPYTTTTPSPPSIFNNHNTLLHQLQVKFPQTNTYFKKGDIERIRKNYPKSIQNLQQNIHSFYQILLSLLSDAKLYDQVKEILGFVVESGDQYVVREVVDWVKGVLESCSRNDWKDGMKLKLKDSASKMHTDKKEYQNENIKKATNLLEMLIKTGSIELLILTQAELLPLFIDCYKNKTIPKAIINQISEWFHITKQISTKYDGYKKLHDKFVKKCATHTQNFNQQEIQEIRYKTIQMKELNTIKQKTMKVKWTDLDDVLRKCQSDDSEDDAKSFVKIRGQNVVSMQEPNSPMPQFKSFIHKDDVQSYYEESYAQLLKPVTQLPQNSQKKLSSKVKDINNTKHKNTSSQLHQQAPKMSSVQVLKNSKSASPVKQIPIHKPFEFQIVPQKQDITPIYATPKAKISHRFLFSSKRNSIAGSNPRLSEFSMNSSNKDFNGSAWGSQAGVKPNQFRGNNANIVSNNAQNKDEWMNGYQNKQGLPKNTNYQQKDNGKNTPIKLGLQRKVQKHNSQRTKRRKESLSNISSQNSQNNSTPYIPTSTSPLTTNISQLQKQVYLHKQKQLKLQQQLRQKDEIIQKLTKANQRQLQLNSQNNSSGHRFHSDNKFDFSSFSYNFSHVQDKDKAKGSQHKNQNFKQVLSSASIANKKLGLAPATVSYNIDGNNSESKDGDARRNQLSRLKKHVLKKKVLVYENSCVEVGMITKIDMGCLQCSFFITSLVSLENIQIKITSPFPWLQPFQKPQQKQKTSPQNQFTLRQKLTISQLFHPHPTFSQQLQLPSLHISYRKHAEPELICHKIQLPVYLNKLAENITFDIAQFKQRIQNENLRHRQQSGQKVGSQGAEMSKNIFIDIKVWRNLQGLSKYFPLGLCCADERLFVALMAGLSVRFYLVVTVISKSQANLCIVPQSQKDSNTQILDVFLKTYTQLLSI